MKIIGHRGAAELAPENTLAAIKKALAAQVDEIEIDIRVTKDQQIVVVHDPEITDKLGNSFKIDEHTYDELHTIKPDLPLFSQVVETVARRVPLLVEVKPKVNTVPIIAYFEWLLDNGWAARDFSLCSFSQRILRVLHQALPSVRLVVNSSFSGLNAVRRARQLKTKRISMNQKFIWSGFIIAMHRGGYQLNAYTLNNPSKAKRWAKFGLAAVITNRPDLYNNN